MMYEVNESRLAQRLIAGYMPAYSGVDRVLSKRSAEELGVGDRVDGQVKCLRVG
jgi:hypothetical protein